MGLVGACVLIVDDDVQMARAWGRVLVRDGVRVLVAEDAPEALAIIRAGDVDVMITDMLMPRMSGVGLCYEVRRIDPALPVIVVSGLPLDEQEERLELLADGIAYLEKPVEIARLRRAVRDAVRLSRARRR